MSYKVFIEVIKNCLRMQLDKEYEVQIKNVSKNNRKECMVLMVSRISFGKFETGWSVDMEGIYQAYKDGKSMEDCVNSLLDVFRNEEVNEEILSDVAEVLYNWEKAKERIYPMLIGRKGNEDYLSNLLHRPFMNMEIVYYITIEVDGGKANTKVTNSLSSCWDKTEEEIYTRAMENLNNTGFELRGLTELVKQMGDPVIEEMEEPMYVLQNKNRCYGAAGILSEQVMQMCEDKLKGDFYLLPSSVHEMIVMPVKEQVSVNVLKRMVVEINQKVVLPEERLCDNVFFYCYGEKKIQKIA